MSDRDVRDPDSGGEAPREAPDEHHAEPPPGAHAMNLLRWVLFAGLLVLAVVSVGSFLLSHRPGSSTSAHAHARYYCPMHPSYTSDRPGECPICGMSLEPIPAAGIGATAGSGGDVHGLTSVHLTPDRLQMIGVRTARVEKRAVGGDLSLAGVVAPDEGRLYRVQLRLAGWVKDLFVTAEGQSVSAGQPLCTVTSPQLYQTEQEYLIELSARTLGGGAGGHDGGGLGAARGRLVLFGVPHDEIRRLGSEKVAQANFTVPSPVNGVVIERNATQGQQVTPDAPLYTIADLSHVWVLADLYELDFGRVKAGDRAIFTSEALGGRARDGRVELVAPTISAETRTLKVRLSLENPDGKLRPGMYGRVQITGRGGQALVVPGEAVIDSGDQQYVFLAHAGGEFEPRRVWTGARNGDRVQIVKGVAEGDTVVASASFLIDSESRLKAAINGMGAQPGAPHPH